MEPYTRGKLGIIACESSRHFAEKVIEQLKKITEKEKETNGDYLIKTKETQFSNTEIKTELEESIRNKDIYIFQDVENKSNGFNVNDNLFALKTAIQAAKMADAHFITAVIPAYPYARQDKPKTREGISAAMIARELEDIGAGRVITLDIHNEAIGGFFRKAILENLRASKSFMDYIKKNIGLKDLVIVAPDAGGAARANFYAKKLGTKLALIHKERDYSKTSTIENMELIGDVEGKNVFVVDDLLDTGGTVVNAAKKLKEKGADKIYFAVSLALLNGPAVERIEKAYKEGFITKIIGTDVIFHGKDFAKKHDWYEEVSLAKYFAKVIYNINRGISISRLLE
ncbi:MAG: ribose-phosphate diphosphokinase [Nanoarchaeota archaeon]|nr:ribose-phosphate diphosphokinase [Nanoarchaeota archaeon]MBU1321212.1 ribose-phosphate diphosphokinase [Nanoarchaeota archaeon]MBU1597017.1 ribose-phosphate diphosphokinase [Nanoarchaeota archaeon]MBU2441837.1 ribose-phosphate diphosphokinase [Nanoarchaeota archaeon]